MLIVALVLAVIGLIALVTAVVTSNELIAWVCIGASVVGVLLLIVDAVRERSRDNAADLSDDSDPDEPRDDDTTVLDPVEEYPDEPETHATEAVPAEPDGDGETVAVSTEHGDDDPEQPKRD